MVTGNSVKTIQTQSAHKGLLLGDPQRENRRLFLGEGYGSGTEGLRELSRILQTETEQSTGRANENSNFGTLKGPFGATLGSLGKTTLGPSIGGTLSAVKSSLYGQKTNKVH